MERQQGYIVERIVSNHRQELCFDGVLVIQELPTCLCPPLVLCDAEAVQIKTSGFCWSESQTDQLEITLLCSVIDQRGQRAQGIAQIMLEACSAQRIRGNVRRGAQITIHRACYYGESRFQICADVCLHTVISCSEMIVPSKACAPACPQLPLYPPAPRGRVRSKARMFFGS